MSIYEDRCGSEKYCACPLSFWHWIFAIEGDLQKACAVSVAAAPEYADVKLDEIRTQVLAYGEPKDFEVIEDPDSIMGHGSVAEILLDGKLVYRLPIYSFGDLWFVDRAIPSGEYMPADDPN